MFYIGLYRENVKKKILLSETNRLRALIGGMYHHLVDLYQVCSNYTLGVKNGLWGQVFYIGLYRENVNKSCQKPQGLEP